MIGRPQEQKMQSFRVEQFPHIYIYIHMYTCKVHSAYVVFASCRLSNCFVVYYISVFQNETTIPSGTAAGCPVSFPSSSSSRSYGCRSDEVMFIGSSLSQLGLSGF